MAGNLQGSSGNDEIGTPDYLYDALDQQFQFDYDPASSHENHRTERYSTLDGTFLYEGRLLGHDGLAYPWSGRRVFVNPPYSRGNIDAFVDKMIAERNEAAVIVGLVKVDTSTGWWRKLSAHAHVEYLPRVRYKGMKGRATFASAVVIMRKDYPR